MNPADPTSPRPITTNPLVHDARRLAVASMLALIALSLAWELFLAPLRPGGSWLALKALPLCIPLAGFLKNRMYTYRWVSLLVWMYFTGGVLSAWSDRPPRCGRRGRSIPRHRRRRHQRPRRRRWQGWNVWQISGSSWPWCSLRQVS